MTMRIHHITTYLRADEAFTIVEFLDQLRERLLHTYGDEIKSLLQEASPPISGSSEGMHNDKPF